MTSRRHTLSNSQRSPSRRKLTFEQLCSRVVLSAGGLSPLALPPDVSITAVMASRRGPEPRFAEPYAAEPKFVEQHAARHDLVGKEAFAPERSGPAFGHRAAPSRGWVQPVVVVPQVRPQSLFVASALQAGYRHQVLIVSQYIPPAPAPEAPPATDSYSQPPSQRIFLGSGPGSNVEVPSPPLGVPDVTQPTQPDDTATPWQDGRTGSVFFTATDAVAFSTDVDLQSSQPQARTGGNTTEPRPSQELRDSMLEPEGGLIELEGPQAALGRSLVPSRDSEDEPETLDGSAREILEQLWAELGKAWDFAAAAPAEPEATAEPEAETVAEESGAVPPQPAEIAWVEGMIELTTDDVQPSLPPAAAVVEVEDGRPTPAGLPAGVAVFQAFELATPADAAPLPEGTAERVADELPAGEEHAAADEAGETSGSTSRALTGAGLLAALPFSLRKLRRNRQRQRTDLMLP